MTVADETLEKHLQRLRACIARNDEMGVTDATFSLQKTKNQRPPASDEVVERLLRLLDEDEMYKSHLTGHILMFFQFESERLTDHEKWLCIRFLNENGDKFSDAFSRQVVSELRYGLSLGDPLKMKKPNSQQWKDYLKMRGESKK